MRRQYWTIIFFETKKAENRHRKELRLESTEKLLLNFLKARDEKRISPKHYYKHFYSTYLEAWTFLGHSERNLRDVFNHCREMLIKVYKEDPKKFSQLELAMNIKWGQTIDEE